MTLLRPVGSGGRRQFRVGNKRHAGGDEQKDRHDDGNSPLMETKPRLQLLDHWAQLVVGGQCALPQHLRFGFQFKAHLAKCQNVSGKPALQQLEEIQRTQ